MILKLMAVSMIICSLSLYADNYFAEMFILDVEMQNSVSNTTQQRFWGYPNARLSKHIQLSAKAFAADPTINKHLQDLLKGETFFKVTLILDEEVGAKSISPVVSDCVQSLMQPYAPGRSIQMVLRNVKLTTYGGPLIVAEGKGADVSLCGVTK